MRRVVRAAALSALALGCDASRPVEVARTTEPRPESDEHPVQELIVGDVHLRALSRVSGAGATFVVTDEHELVRIDRGGRKTLLERAVGRPCVLDDGSVVVSRLEEPGETDLWLVSEDGAARALAPATGPDDLPFALPDGRVGFVSGRTTIASLWVVDPATGAVTQVTNRGLAAGKPLVGFVPPPERVLSVSSARVVYDAGRGKVVEVELP